MKFQTFIYIILCFDLVLSSSTNDVILEPKKSLILEPLNNQIYFFFNTESFDVSGGSKEILFQIKSIKGSLDINSVNPISFQFINSQTEISINLETNTIPAGTDGGVNLESSVKENKNPNGTEYELKYFKITKNSNKNLLYVKFGTKSGITQKIYVEISNIQKIPSSINVPSGSNAQILKKYGSISVDASDFYVFFDCSYFEDGEDMYFKIQAYEDAYYPYDYYLSNGIYYDYINDDPNQDFNNYYYYVEYGINFDFDRDSYGYSLKTKYFTIKKNKNQFRGGEGNLMYISFYFYYGKVTITNTEEDEGKLKTWEIVLIVIACVLVIGIAVFCICWRRRKILQARAAMNNPYTANGYPPNAMPPAQPYY